MASVALRGISKSFDTTPVLSGIDIDIADGEFVTLVGASGCGKSTLIRIIAGLEPQSAGSVEVGGRAIDHLRPHERRVAMCWTINPDSSLAPARWESLLAIPDAIQNVLIARSHPER